MVQGRLGLAILKSHQASRFNQQPYAKNSVPAQESLAISVLVGGAGDVATQIASDCGCGWKATKATHPQHGTLQEPILFDNRKLESQAVHHQSGTIEHETLLL